jgi:catechol 2,3-dioxygenase-like lactoylglutathione lyase family enzyme
MAVALEFYGDILGLEVVTDCIEEGPYFESLVGLPNAKARIIKLHDRSGGMIELLEYLQPVSPVLPDGAANHIGCSHVAFTVARLGDLTEQILQAGYSLNSDPLLSPDGKVRVVYCNGPDGTLVELVELLS